MCAMRGAEPDTTPTQPVEPIIATDLSDDGEWELEP